ncbi:MFS transporter [Streptomyces albidoflavus]|uniref:MFS transporter n=1 Tax=Streptomyces albidoflavus TaxID=1886 RepID=UPI000BAE2AFD|nr:MFS transporter [Streptomyces albidoflavus]PAX87805.1 MFS transporter [Streptomyces albidoflavus]PAX92590.1 MFS transporter [Streptomyces albidoflavus]PBO19072.1 MFS transporter [Streptomyces albidoflavus]PBO24229.1 MFS transporter [Streptomyces albidoflavus]PBO30087.1 MFS transporter [Streptomyces albidoflavus]
MLDQATRRWRAALFVFMLVAGVGMASWVARTPAVRDALGVSTGGMGVVLFGLSTGSMTGVLVSGPLVRRFGGRAVMWGGAAVLTAGLAVTAGGAQWSLAGGVFAGLALFGSGLGLAEVAVNIEGAAVERRIGRPVLPVLHGCFSLGTVLGALLGLALTAAHFPVGAHLLAVAVLTAAATVWAVRAVPTGTGREAAEAAAGPRDRLAALRVWRDGRLVLIGMIVLVMAFTEGAANDWLPLLMVDGHGVSATAGSLTYTAFAVAMTVGRFAGGPFLERFGRAAVVRASAAVAAVGVALVVFSPSPLAAGAAVVLWGLGASLGFPVSISAAGDDPEGAAARVSAVATAGYLAFLVGPPSLGFLADHVGLRPTMGVVLGLLVVAALLAPALRPRGPRVAATAVPPRPDATTAAAPDDGAGRP